jgi:myo-inositol-1(or 4)-monophosphatase
MQPMANIALRAARKAADYLSRSMDRQDEFEIHSKGRNDFVSNIDRIAESLIIKQIRETYPEHNILAEESGSLEGNSEFTWIIDPLDGTLNFLQGIPHFAVSIGVMKGLHHEHGVIVDPVRGEEFVASRGSGAQLNGKRIRVTTRAKLEDCVLGTGIPPGSMSRIEDYSRSLQTLTGTCRGIRRAGSAALDLAYVAAGRMDGFWEMGLSKWDTAAGIVLVREAGGFISDLSGGEKFWETGDIVAANPKCFKSFIQALKA